MFFRYSDKLIIINEDPLISVTETAVRTEDGKLMREYRDDSGNYRTEVTNKDQYGFVADVLMDFQVGEIRDNLLFGMS